MSHGEPLVLRDPAETASASPRPTTAKPRTSQHGQRSRRASSVAPRSNEAPAFFVAGFWSRLVAAFIDLAIMLPIAFLFCWVAGALTGMSLPASRLRGIDFWLNLLLAKDPTLLGALGLTLAIGTVYSLIFHVSMARTPGMRALKLRIIDVYGDEPTTVRALARTAGYWAGLASLGLGFIWIAFDSEKRGLQDWIAGTYVVKNSPKR